MACTHRYGYAINTLAEIYEKEEYNLKNLEECGKWLIEGAMNNEIHCYLKIANICLSGKALEYGWENSATHAKHAVVDFLIASRFLVSQLPSTTRSSSTIAL